jgi:hypothetical protein
MLFGILNILFGTLVVFPSFVAQDKRQEYAKIISWAGIVLLIWGVMGIVSSLLNIQTLAVAPLYWILWIGGGVTGLLLGIILACNLLKKSSGEIVNKLLPYQRIIGFVAIVIGVLQLFIRI